MIPRGGFGAVSKRRTRSAVADARRYKCARGEAEFLVRLRGAEERTVELLLEKEMNDREKDQLREQLRKVTEDCQIIYKREAENLSAECEKLQLRSELDKLRALNLQRQESQEQLAEERAQLKKERQRTDAWIRDLVVRHGCEKQFLEERICCLEFELGDFKLAERRNLTDDGDYYSESQAAVGGTVGVRDSSTRDSTRGGGHRDRMEEVSGEAIQLLCVNEGSIGVARPVLDGDPSGAGEATASARGQGSQPQGQSQ